MWGCIILFIIILLICVILCHSRQPVLTEQFLFINDGNLYMPSKDKIKPETIKYQIPVAQNQLTDLQLQSLDTDVLRNIRTLVNFSNTDELDFYQMYNLIKKMKDKTIDFKFDLSSIKKKSNIIPSEKLIELNTGAINTTDLELFYRLKLELISLFNNLVISTGYYLPYHQYQFFKIINSNLISQMDVPTPTTTSNSFIQNYVFTITVAREFKYQQFVFYYDIDLIKVDEKNYTARINKLELIGIPMPKTIEFRDNLKTTDKPDIQSAILNSPNKFLNSEQLLQNDLMNLIAEKQRESKDDIRKLDIYKDQVLDSSKFNVQPIGTGSIFQSPNTKFIDLTEVSDMDRTLFDTNSQSAFVEQRLMNVARDQQFKNHRCYGLINGVSEELTEYNDNPIFCNSYHPEISQVGIWDAPCQINTDCPFYQANKNYPNEFGKCNKETGKCEMPMGIIPIGFKKYGRIEPDCYNCDISSSNNKCCGKQAEDIKTGKVAFTTPDYIFQDDNIYRKKYSNELEEIGLKANPSI